jgi:hypothetical protein
MIKQFFWLGVFALGFAFAFGEDSSLLGLLAACVAIVKLFPTDATQR